MALTALGCGKTSDSGDSNSPLSCAAPTMECNGECANIAEDPANCGSCGAACPAGDVCVEGTCGSTGCPAGQHDCGGLCVDLETNAANCGACNAACSPVETCSGGACTCAAPTQKCDGVCTDVQTSMMHCGACGNACAADQLCVDGTCQARCQPGLSLCGEACVDLSSDSTHCGTCGTACAANEVCAGGQCQCPNDAAHAICEGACVDLQTNAEHCGGCGNVCSAGMHCQGGLCTSCSSGFFYCPSATGDPLETCLAQAADAMASTDAGSATPRDATTADATTVPPLAVDLACQCTHCLVELTDCVNDPYCTTTWQCAVRNACTVPCWGSMGICPTSSGTGGCWKFCSPSTGSTQTAARAEALQTCTMDNGCGM